MADYDAIVIGAGCGGLAAGALLAKQGRKVLVVEQSKAVGGCCSTFEKDGFLFDTGATILEIVDPIERLSETAIPGLADHVVTMEVATPLDFERRLLMPEGSFLALQMDVPSLTVFRPSARSKSVQGLYLAGSSTHPGGGGGGVPTTVASGMMAAGLVERYEG